MDIMPWDFWKLTPHEFSIMTVGFLAKQELKQGRDAWILANLIQPHVKKRMRPAMFLRNNKAPDDPGEKLEKIIGLKDAEKERFAKLMEKVKK